MMKFEFKFNEIDQEASQKINNANSLNNRVNLFLKKKEYGKDILEYKIICICVKIIPGYENWFKVRRPKYIEHEIIKSELTGETYETRRTFIHEIKLDKNEYEYFVEANDIESEKFIANKIITAIGELKKTPKKIKDFDKERFKADLESFFKEQGLI